ncbi:glycoside hydrolase 5 family protein [Pseudonocardia sp. HH130630-07]|uniref:glycoside hydrolase 5 family protein n=1 Tax=Pseudonocardia sp. HH130630-07 TaxID=1690815 RepID=UPI000814DFB6|nr:glycosyl hydrolase [Pseudonocardia sp. HH130630-07]ANY09081.1 glycosyl hydrolase [Pseudonocardia sp. HH130630-07]
MRFGVNYTPSGDWFFSWLDFSPERVARDLDRIAELGVDHVRIFPLWPVIQPNRSLIRSAGIDDVVTVVDLARSAGLDVNVDALQGHLSSFDFVPSWLQTWHRRNLFTDEQVVTSTERYVHALTTAVAGRDNLMGVTVGNEVNQFAHDPHPDPYRIHETEGDTWLRRMIAAIRAGLRDGGAAPSVLATLAQYDAAWYDDAQPFGPRQAAEHGDATVVHSWVFNGAAAVHGPLGAGSVRHAEYLLTLAAAWSPDPARPSWLQEVGAPNNVLAVEQEPEFVERTLRHAMDVGELLGVTWWCSHDVPRTLADFPVFEHSLGLLDETGRLKPSGRRFAEVVADLRARRPAPRPASTAVVLDDIDATGSPVPGHRASCAPGGSFAGTWLRVAEETGRGPQVVLRSRYTAEHLHLRGITETVDLPA